MTSIIFLLAIGLARSSEPASVPAALTEATPAFSLRWTSVTLHAEGGGILPVGRLASGKVVEATLSASTVLRLRGSFVSGCTPRVSRRYGDSEGWLDVPLPQPVPTNDELVVVLPPAVGPSTDSNEEVVPAVVSLTLPVGCQPVDVQAYEASESPDPNAGPLVLNELRDLAEQTHGEETLARWLEAPHAHEWQEQAALALALPRLLDAASASSETSKLLARGLLEQVTTVLRGGDLAFSTVHDLDLDGPTRSLPESPGSWTVVKAGASIEIEVAGEETVRIDHRAVALTDTAVPLAWRVQATFDADPPNWLLAHAPVDPLSIDVSLQRTAILPVPPGVKRLKVVAVDGSLLLKLTGISPKRYLGEMLLGRPAADSLLAEAAEGRDWAGRLARTLLHDKPLVDESDSLNNGPPLLSALLAVWQSERTRDAAQAARLLGLARSRLRSAGTRLEKAAAIAVDAMIVRARARRSVAAANPGEAVSALLALGSKRALSDEDAIALLEADAFAQESLSGNPQPLFAVDGLLARRPLDHELLVARQRAFLGSASWQVLSTDPGPREVHFLDPFPPNIAAVSLEHSHFMNVEPGAGRDVDLPVPPLPGRLPMLSLVSLRSAGGPPIVTVKVDKTSFTIPAVGPFERVDLPVRPGRHRIEVGKDAGSTQVLTNWALGAGVGQRWRRYTEVTEQPVELHNRDVGPGDFALVVVRVVAPAGGPPVRPFELVLSGDALRPVTIPVRPPPLAPSTSGDLDPDVAVSAPLEAVVPVGSENPSFRLSIKRPPEGARVLVHFSVRRRTPAMPSEEPALQVRQNIAETLAADDANLGTVAEVTRRLMTSGRGASTFLGRAAALTGIDEPALAREDLVRVVSDPTLGAGAKNLALTIWRHLETVASSTFPETVDQRSSWVHSPGLGFVVTPMPRRLDGLTRLIDDRPRLRRLDIKSLKAQAGPGAEDFAILAAARQAERDGDLVRAATLWRHMATEKAQSGMFARAGEALLTMPPDPIRDVNAYVDLFEATRLDPHDPVAARLLRRASTRTRLRPVHEVDDSAGVMSIGLAGGDAFDQSVEAAMMPVDATHPGDLLTRDRQLTLSFDLASPISLRVSALLRELRPQGALAAATPPISIEWIKDGQAPHRVACAPTSPTDVCRSGPIQLLAGSHTLVVRLQGGLRPAARVMVEPTHCVPGTPCTNSPVERNTEYLVARSDQPIVVTLFGPGVVETELRAPSGGRRQVTLSVLPAKGPAPPPVRVPLPPSNDNGDASGRSKRLAALRPESARSATAETSAVESIVLKREGTYRVQVRPDKGEVLVRLLLRDGLGTDKPQAPSLPTTLKANAPAPLLTPPNVEEALSARIEDGDVRPGWDDFGSLSVDVGYLTAVDLTEETGTVVSKSAGVAGVTYRRLLDSLNLTLKGGIENRVWTRGNSSQAAHFAGYFMHPAARWARVYGSADWVTQSTSGVRSSASRGTLMFEPIATLASGVHLVSKVGLQLQNQTLKKVPDEVLPLLDPDLFNERVAWHRQALFWEEDLELEPLANLLLFGGGRFTSNREFSVTHPDHFSGFGVLRAGSGHFVVEAGARWTWFLTGIDRDQLLLRRRASLAALYTFWIGHTQSFTLGAELSQYFEQRIPQMGFTLEWELSNGRRFRDHTPIEGENYFYPARGPGRESGRLTIEGQGTP